MILSFLSFIFVFTIIVLVHEFGHFTAAKSAGVKIYEFSIGFPFSPKILSLFRFGETEFTLRLLPLGGFVSFSKDGNEDSIDLFKTSRFNRAVILLSGSIFNILFSFLAFSAVLFLDKNMSLSASFIASLDMVWSIISQTMAFIFNIITGTGSAEGLIGPVGIASFAGKAAGGGFFSLLYFSGLLSISLGIMNLLPFPALDGGHIFILLVESVRQKALNPKIYQTVSALGMLLFVLLTLFVTYHDIVRLVA